MIQSVGSLAATQQVLDRIETDVETADARENLATVNHFNEAALYLGRLSREVALEHREALAEGGVDATASFIRGG